MRIHTFWNTNLTKNMFTEKKKTKTKAKTKKKTSIKGGRKGCFKEISNQFTV